MSPGSLSRRKDNEARALLRFRPRETVNSLRGVSLGDAAPDGGGLTAKQRARREQVRFEAAELFTQGVTPPQVARRLRVSRKPAYTWHARQRGGGVQALRSKGPSGRPSRMKPE
ncbi:helix-turn-helix domain-containing protein [Streptomyces sp. NPDC048191]|uniref:helix-turn-helix domain-containing protein n=1 Tax=Streptomyces sp. NPDC048191 TaxID=3155484 RepID=UPI0033E37FB1